MSKSKTNIAPIATSPKDVYVPMIVNQQAKLFLSLCIEIGLTPCPELELLVSTVQSVLQKFGKAYIPLHTLFGKSISKAIDRELTALFDYCYRVCMESTHEQGKSMFWQYRDGGVVEAYLDENKYTLGQFIDAITKNLSSMDGHIKIAQECVGALSLDAYNAYYASRIGRIETEDELDMWKQQVVPSRERMFELPLTFGLRPLFDRLSAIKQETRLDECFKLLTYASTLTHLLRSDSAWGAAGDRLLPDFVQLLTGKAGADGLTMAELVAKVSRESKVLNSKFSKVDATTKSPYDMIAFYMSQFTFMNTSLPSLAFGSVEEKKESCSTTSSQ